MRREPNVRYCERAVVKFRRATHLAHSPAARWDRFRQGPRDRFRRPAIFRLFESDPVDCAAARSSIARARATCYVVEGDLRIRVESDDGESGWQGISSMMRLIV